MIDFNQTPQEIAEELIDNFREIAFCNILFDEDEDEDLKAQRYWAKECASASVELMLSVCPKYQDTISGTWDNPKYQILLDVKTILETKLK